MVVRDKRGRVYAFHHQPLSDGFLASFSLNRFLLAFHHLTCFLTLQRLLLNTFTMSHSGNGQAPVQPAQADDVSLDPADF